MGASNNDSYPSGREAGYAIVVLVLVTTVAYLDRQLPLLLVQPLKQAFGVTDTQISLLQGYAFALFYTLMGIPFGMLVDRANRRRLIIWGVAVWGLLTILSGMAQEFWHLLLLRVGVGIGEAVLLPAATSMIADYVRPQQRGRALGVYYTAQSLGAGASLVLGGVIITALGEGNRVIPGLGSFAPWQLVFIAAGLPALLTIALMFTIREPARHEVAVADMGETTRFLPYFRTQRRTYLTLFGSYSLLAFVAFATTNWMPAFYQRQFGVSIGNAGLMVGLITVVSGMTGALLGGFFSDRWRAGNRPGGRLKVLMLGWLTLAVVLPIWPLVANLWVSYALLVPIFVALAISTSSVAAVFQEMTPNRLRGRVMAITLLLAGLCGFGFGPLAVALVTDQVFGTEAGLRWALLIVPVPAVLLGTLLTASAFGPYRRSVVSLLPQSSVAPS